MDEERKDIAVCLSGGGMRGAVHLGVMQYLQERGFRVRAMSGTSIGALLGSLLAAGHSPRELLSLMLHEDIRKLFLPVGRISRGLFTPVKIRRLLEELIPHNSFEGLGIPFYCCAVNLQRGEAVIFGEGTLHDKVMASISIPLLFRPVTIEGDDYVDGGVLNNLPVEPLLGRGMPVVGVHANNYLIRKIDTGKDIFRRVMQLTVRQSVLRNKGYCDHFIEPLLEKDYRLFDRKVAGELYEAGYRAAREYFERKPFTGS